MITVFGYDFPHRKTCEGLIQLKLLNIEIDMVYLAPWKKLDAPRSYFRACTRDVTYPNPSDICKLLDIPYAVTPHEDVKELHEHGLILGARILPDEVLNKFEDGIINFHPGILPHLRGLETYQRAILNNIPQANTIHYITKRIDHGPIKKIIITPIYDDDGWLDIWDRTINRQMINCIRYLFNSEPEKTPIPKKVYEYPKDYNMFISPDRFSHYCWNYGKVVSEFKEQSKDKEYYENIIW